MNGVLILLSWLCSLGAQAAADTLRIKQLQRCGERVLNWSWGIHRVGARNVKGDEVDPLVRSGLAMSGYASATVPTSTCAWMSVLLPVYAQCLPRLRIAARRTQHPW